MGGGVGVDGFDSVSSPPIQEVTLLRRSKSKQKNPQIGIVSAHRVVMT